MGSTGKFILSTDVMVEKMDMHYCKEKNKNINDL